MELPVRQGTGSGASRILRRPRAGSNESDIENKGPLGLTTLYNPPLNAIADLIFVHGLTGGSRSSWSKNNEPNLFWPQEWLPNDPKFQDVRIHSFGYTSKLGGESILNINDFVSCHSFVCNFLLNKSCWYVTCSQQICFASRWTRKTPT